MIDLLAFLSKPDNFDLQWTVKAFLSHFALGYIFSLFLYLLLIRLFAKWTKKVLYYALFVALVGAFASVVIDADHIVLLFGDDYGRPWHKPMAFISGTVAVLIIVRLLSIRNKCRIEYAQNYRIKSADKHLLFLIVAFCIILHVLEDYLLGWF